VTSLDAIELAVARTLAEAENASETYGTVLAAIGSGLGWQLGAVWEVAADGRALRCVSIWQAADADAEEFVELTRRLALAPGEGLPGRVWASGEPAWVPDVPIDPNFPRAHAGTHAGLRAAFAFPIRAPTHVCGAMEFFSGEFHEPDEPLLASMAVLGSLIGQFVVRRRAEQESHERAALTRAILGSALDAVITMDGEGKVLEFNRAAESIFGHASEDTIDRDMADLIVPPSLRSAHRAGLKRYLETGRGSYLDKRIEITGLRADGHEFPVELTITRIDRPGPPVFAGFIRDITERKQAEEDLRASRARLVETGDAERQRLERNLHDGAQQHLVSLALKLRLAADSVEKNSGRALRLLKESSGDLEAALHELRELARGIHPALLTDRGLAAALIALVHRSPLHITLSDPPSERLPEPVEAAAYYVIAEGLTNVTKYAGVDEATVSVGVTRGLAVIEVADAGVGGADTSEGSGLWGLADRVEALGGHLLVESAPGAGTRLRAEIPLVAASERNIGS
jgi:PAS domain S-box-containing protein